jgi:nucleoside-diphosphate-sugar epimerase
VRRFLFLSSLKVNGEGRSHPYDEDATPVPSDPYAISKWEAEEALRQVAATTGMEVVILRPPLVYGPGVKANFLRLLQTVNSGIPLPFSSIANQRSLIYLGNLVDAIVSCLGAPAAAGQTYLVSDGQDVSTPDLVRAMALALQRPARLLPCPISLLRLAGRALGREAAIDRLVGTLQVNSLRIRADLSWTPPYTLAQGMQETANWFRTKADR